MDAVDAELARIAPDYDWQGGEWNPLTLLAAALTSSPEIARARATLAAARAEAAAARIGPGPTLSLTAEYAFNPPETSNWLYGIASDFLLDRGGRREGRIEAADVAARAAEFDYAAAVWSVRMAVRRAFDKRAVSIREAAVASELVAMRRRQFDAVRRRVDAGEVSRLELDRVRADLSASLQAELGARAGISRATVDLLAALGLPSDAIETDRIAGAPSADLPALPAVTPAQVASSLELRTEILQATAAYDRSEAALRVAVASQYPQVSLGPGYTWERGLAKLPFNLSLSLPTSDRAHALIAAAEARRAEAGKQLEAAVAAVTSSIARADADYRAAFAALDLVRSETLPTATALARQADVEFDAGAINRADWAASQAGLLTAKLDEITAADAVLTAEAALEDALRRPLRPPETVIGSTLFTPSTESDR
jgi:outer membrane protein TolC